MPPTSTQIKADPNVFAAAFMAGIEAGIPSLGVDGVLGKLKTRWHAFREFVEWVNSGQADEEYRKDQARAAAILARQAEVARLDAEAEAKRLEAAAAAHGAK